MEITLERYLELLKMIRFLGGYKLRSFYEGMRIEHEIVIGDKVCILVNFTNKRFVYKESYG